MKTRHWKCWCLWFIFFFFFFLSQKPIWVCYIEYNDLETSDYFWGILGLYLTGPLNTWKARERGKWHAAKGRRSESNTGPLRWGVNLYIWVPALPTELSGCPQVIILSEVYRWEEYIEEKKKHVFAQTNVGTNKGIHHVKPKLLNNVLIKNGCSFKWFNFYIYWRPTVDTALRAAADRCAGKVCWRHEVEWNAIVLGTAHEAMCNVESSFQVVMIQNLLLIITVVNSGDFMYSVFVSLEMK